MTEDFEEMKSDLVNCNTNPVEPDKIQKEWHEKLVQSYQNLYAITSNNIPDVWPALEFALSLKSILNIRDCTLPFAGILLGAPSSLKTVALELFRGCDHTYYSHNFSAKSWVSHSATVKKDKLKDIDMLPRIKKK
ncbi:MAG: hypothetical protein DLM72_09960 [Candidatus Nitrosopolaris wilkensis]|nr:MAG: hypothetical protein DLM72_09960 [Candidatus Nitrosopolaris wilkensis]